LLVAAKLTNGILNDGQLRVTLIQHRFTAASLSLSLKSDALKNVYFKMEEEDEWPSGVIVIEKSLCFVNAHSQRKSRWSLKD
jgi:hypothetical protein